MHHSISLTMQGTNRIIHAKLVQKGIVVSFLTAHELILPWEIIRTHIIYYIFVGAQTFARTELRGSLRRAAH